MPVKHTHTHTHCGGLESNNEDRGDEKGGPVQLVTVCVINKTNLEKKKNNPKKQQAGRQTDILRTYGRRDTYSRQTVGLRNMTRTRNIRNITTVDYKSLSVASSPIQQPFVYLN